MHPPTTLPGGQGAALNIGVTTNFGATITDDEGQTSEIVYWPRKSILGLSMLSLALRKPMGSACDLGGRIALGRLGGDLRCGLGDEGAGIYISQGAYYLPWHGAQLRTDLQAGTQQGSFFGIVTTGLAGTSFTHRSPLDGFGSSESPLHGPSAPAVDIKQRELAWTTSLLIGLRERRSEPLLTSIAFTFEVPIATSDATFDCVSCENSYRDFDPGWRVGVSLSFTAAGLLPAALTGAALR